MNKQPKTDTAQPDQAEKIKRHLTKTLIEKAIGGSFGNITLIAQRVKCDRKTIYTWLKKESELQELVDLEREKILDLAESKLIAKINEGSESLIALTLRTLGRKRGYGDTVDVNNNSQPAVVFIEDLRD